MRSGPLLVPALAAFGALAMPPSAPAQTSGGAQAPGSSGGVQYGAPTPSARPESLTVRSFRPSPATIPAGADSLRLVFRVDGGAPRVIVRLSIIRTGERAVLRPLRLRARTGRRYVRRVRLSDARLAPGSYDAVLHARDVRPRGRALRAAAASTRVALRVAVPEASPPPSPTPTPAAPVSASAPVGAGVFPVRGPYSFGDAGARFGSDRGGRPHRGQDVIAAEGTPLVAPRPGAVHVRAYQGGGAGHYVVVRGTDSRDYVFMHMRDASPLPPGTPVAAGTPIGHVGNTGSSSGAHLHFEIWPAGWYASESSLPIDPLPELLAWAGG